MNDSNKWRNFIRIITILNAIAWPVILGWAKYITFKTIENDKTNAVQSKIVENLQSSLVEIKGSLLRIENKIYSRR